MRQTTSVCSPTSQPFCSVASQKRLQFDLSKAAELSFGVLGQVRLEHLGIVALLHGVPEGKLHSLGLRGTLALSGRAHDPRLRQSCKGTLWVPIQVGLILGSVPAR